jgi:hypothetical protein
MKGYEQGGMPLATKPGFCVCETRRVRVLFMKSGRLEQGVFQVEGTVSQA